jgi:hypothetical protein
MVPSRKYESAIPLEIMAKTIDDWRLKNDWTWNQLTTDFRARGVNLHGVTIFRVVRDRGGVSDRTVYKVHQYVRKLQRLRLIPTDITKLKQRDLDDDDDDD